MKKLLRWLAIVGLAHALVACGHGDSSAVQEGQRRAEAIVRALGHDWNADKLIEVEDQRMLAVAPVPYARRYVADWARVLGPIRDQKTLSSDIRYQPEANGDVASYTIELYGQKATGQALIMLQKVSDRWLVVFFEVRVDDTARAKAQALADGLSQALASDSDSASGPHPTQRRTIDGPKGGDVQQMLDQADAAKSYGITSTTDMGRRLVSPPDGSAVALYRKVLIAQPANRQARQGLQDIAAFYANFARRTCDKSLFDECKIEAGNGLLADPDNAELKQLAKRADEATRPNPTQPRTIEGQTSADVQQMLDQADAYKQYGTTSGVDIGRNLIFPPGSNAVDLYRKVLAVQPANQRAMQGLSDITAFYAKPARRMCDQRLFDACKAQAENELRADPDNVELKELANRAIEAMRERAPDH